MVPPPCSFHIMGIFLLGTCVKSCFYGQRVTDAGDALPLERGRRRQQCSGGGEQNFFQPLFRHLPQHESAQHRRRAAAATGPGVHILFLNIIEQHAAVLIIFAHIHAVLLKKLRHNLVAQNAQVAGEDQVVVCRPGAGSLEMGGESVVGRGGHGRRRRGLPERPAGHPQLSH